MPTWESELFPELFQADLGILWFISQFLTLLSSKKFAKNVGKTLFNENKLKNRKIMGLKFVFLSFIYSLRLSAVIL